ncbi:MAG: DinB family protein [Candidatus Eiseniibacteriota bacterium]
MKKPAAALPLDLDECARAYHRDQVRAQALVDGLSPAEFIREPEPGSWSVGQCLDHLNVQGGLMLPRLDRGIEKTRERSGGVGNVTPGVANPIDYGWFDRLFVRSLASVKGRPTQRMRTPRAFVPRSHLTIEGVVQSFLILQEELLARVERARGLALSRVRVGSAATPLIRVRLGAWFAAIAVHQERHLEQARRAREAIGRPLAAWPQHPMGGGT